ncbi:MAG: hypothetical protein RL196_1332 [Actinomycetota bacterium]|jgi:hypothetical protein
MSEKDFDFVEQPPTDINDVYDYEKRPQGSSRVKAGLLMTSGFVIFGILVGGGAFAMTGSLPNILPGAGALSDPAATDPAATDPAATDPASTDPGVVDPSATPTDPTATDPALLDPSATPTDPSSTDPSATSGPQIVVPPVFSNGDDEGDDEGEHKAKQTKKPKPTATSSVAPTFGGGDDQGDSEGESDDD